MHVDGSSTSIATRGRVVLITPEKTKLEYAIRFGFEATNNKAEYELMIIRLCLARKLREKKYNSQERIPIGSQASIRRV